MSSPPERPTVVSTHIYKHTKKAPLGSLLFKFGSELRSSLRCSHTLVYKKATFRVAFDEIWQ